MLLCRNVADHGYDGGSTGTTSPAELLHTQILFPSVGCMCKPARPAVLVSTMADFTGKERDVETGLDYFGARYLSSAQGRWTSPDWSAAPEAVPYATLADPQTLNLYGYVRNNPLGRDDPNGHETQATLSPEQVESVGHDITTVQKFLNDHPVVKELLVNVVVIVVGRGVVGGGGVEGETAEPASEGPSAPTMRGAQRMGMREQGIPTSQQPVSQESTPAGRQYTYEVPKPGGGTQTIVVQRNLGTDSSHPGEQHVEVGSPKPAGQTDSIGRPRLDSGKTKVVVTPPPPPPPPKPRTSGS